jgi:hypothetical protein
MSGRYGRIEHMFEDGFDEEWYAAVAAVLPQP